jgi:hypothetical protein
MAAVLAPQPVALSLKEWNPTAAAARDGLHPGFEAPHSAALLLTSVVGPFATHVRGRPFRYSRPW